MKRIYLLLPFLLAATAPAQDTNYVLRSDLAAYATVSDLAGYATTADLTNYATASDLATACNARLPATPQTSGTNTLWRVPASTYFDDDLVVLGTFTADEAVFENPATFEAPVVFESTITLDDGLALGGETRTNWPGSRSLTVDDGGSAWVDDGLVWTAPDYSDASIYLTNLADVTNVADRAHTVVVRHIGTDAVTDVYDGPSSTNLLHTLTSTNPTAVFDWCPHSQTWLLR